MIRLIRELLGAMSVAQRKQLVYLQVLVVLTAIFEVVSVAAIGPFMALVGNIELVESNDFIRSIYLLMGLGSPADFLFFVGVLVLAALFLAASFSIFTIWKLSLFAANVGADFGDVLYVYYMRKEFLYHASINSSVLIKQIATEVNRVTDNILQPLVQINARIAAALFISLAVFFYNPLISISGMVVFSVSYYLLYLSVRRKLESNGKLITEYSKIRFSLMSEGFGAIKEIQILGREDYFIDNFKRSGAVFAESYGSSNGLYNMPRFFMEFVVYSGMIGLILVLIRYYDGNLAEVLPVMAVFGIAAFKLLPSFQQIYSGAAQIKSNLSAFVSIKDDLYDARKRIAERMSLDCKGALVGDLALHDVSFRYQGKSKHALNNININIPYKKTVGIVGPSGSGKSTLLDVLIGAINPDSGYLEVGVEKVCQNNMRKWQNSIGYVSQTTLLKEGSIAENIALGLDLKSIDFSRLEKAAKIAHLTDWIATLPDGFMAEVGERGVQISGGQRQRIGIARALYNDAEFLFFDEATSALDGITEAVIMEAIEEVGHSKTIVMVAHRLNTVKNCDHIYMVEDGEVVDQGTYDYLVSNNPYFRDMAKGK